MSEESTPEQSGWLPRHLLLYYSEPGTRARIGELYPAHSAYARDFERRHPGEPSMIGPFPESEAGQPGAMAIFSDPAIAELFARSDPFVLHEVVTEWRIRLWWVTPARVAPTGG